MTTAYSIERWAERAPPNSAMLRFQLLNEGYSVFQWCDQPGVVYGSHKHETAQSHWIISGELEIKVEHVGIFVLGPGDRDFMPAETYHEARVIGDEPVLYLIGEAKGLPAPKPAVTETNPVSIPKKRKARKPRKKKDTTEAAAKKMSKITSGSDKAAKKRKRANGQDDGRRQRV